MERIGIFFRLQEGKAEGYEKAHREIWPEMTEVLDMAGFRNYSIWRCEDKLFAYYELKDKARAEKVLSESEVYAHWRERMTEYVWIDPVTGQKEWPMDEVFYHE